MLGCSSFLALVFFIAFRWIESQALRVGFPPLPKYQFYLAEGSIACYCVTIGTIDEEGIGNLHGPCAIIFFIIWLVTIINMTFYLARMREWDSSVISREACESNNSYRYILGPFGLGAYTIYCNSLHKV